MIESALVKLLVECLTIHEHPLIIRAAANALKECANHKALNPHIVSDECLQAILTQVIVNSAVIDPQTLINL